MIYIKLAIRNASHCIREYIVYFITVVIFITMMYAMSAMTWKEEILNIESFVNELKILMFFAYGIFSCIIFYMNKHLMDYRKKELGVYLLLGLEPMKLTWILVVENFLFICMALGVGTVIGVNLCELLSKLTSEFFEIDYIMSMELSGTAIANIVLFLLFVHGLISYANIEYYNDTNIYDLLNDEKKNEKKLIKDKLIHIWIFVFSVVAIVGSYLLIFIYIYFNKNTVIISVLLFIAGTYSFYYSFSALVGVIKARCSKIYYKGLNIFSFSQFTRKINMNGFYLGSISLLLFVAILSAVLGGEYATSMQVNQMKDQNVWFDIGLRFDKGAIDLSDLESFIKESEFGSIGSMSFSVYENTAEALTNKEGYYLKLSDYNRLLELKGDLGITLDKAKFYVHPVDMDTYMLNKEITLGKNTLEGLWSPHRNKKIDIDRYNKVIYKDRNYLYVLDDSWFIELEPIYTVLLAKTSKPTSNEFNERLWLEIRDKTFEEAGLNENFINCIGFMKTKVLFEQRTSAAAMLFVGYYLCSILIICILTVLAVQLLSDLKSYKDGIKILRQLGVEEREIYRTIKIQIIVYFMCPLILAGVNNILIYICLLKTYIQENEMVRALALLKNISIVGIGLSIVFIIYGMITYYLIKKSIKDGDN
ncbi:FtsX-like permease family protein [Clostridium sp.]|uniref:FtsX-like permease family protein n=1 Tax=Clostridium sp. TaxID=1506 RepID=UPI003F3D16C4